jgi:HEXXH motif-containing protein
MHPSLENQFIRRGLTLAGTAEITPETIQGISGAMSQISLIPSLAASVGALALSAHILTVEDPSFDISFSDPGIPFSIFMSVSQGRAANLRLAEAIIHESMHLQLSLIEQLVPLVNDHRMTLYSPWKREDRPLAGIIHGLYVFCVIDKWLESITTQHTSQEYIIQRRAQIAEEIQEIEAIGIKVGLTAEGQRLLASLLLLNGRP